MQLRERDLQSKAREKGALEARIETMRQEIVAFNIKLKVNTPFHCAQHRLPLLLTPIGTRLQDP